VGERDFIDAVWAIITKLYGEVGASLTGLTLIDYDLEKKIAVIRVLLSALEMVKASLATITKVSAADISIRVLAVSGTLKALYARHK